MSSGKVYAYWSSSYPTAHWVFEWSSESIGAGKTSVSWSVYKGGRATSPSWLDTWCDLSLYYNKSWGKDPLWQSGTLTGSAASFNPQDNTIPATTGQFVIEHEADGTGSFEVYMTGRIHENEIKITRQWQSVEKNLPYSKCSNPSNVTISPDVQKPGGIITVSWEQPEGAESVGSYDVWYQIDGAGTWYKNNTTSLSTTFVLPDTAARGKDIQACVRALGKGGSQYNSEDVYSDKDASRVNELPATPKVDSNVEKVPSTGGEVIFSNFEYGEDEKLYYSKGLLGAKSKINYEQLQVKVGENTDFYFWTWDGLEYCQNPCIKSVSLNTKPKITGCIVSDPNSGAQMINEVEGENGLLYGEISWKITYSAKDNSQIEVTGEGKDVDIFSALSKKIGGLTSSTEYVYILYTRAFDGIEWTDFFECGSYSVTTPNISCRNDNEGTAPFSKKLLIEVLKSYPITGVEFSDGTKIEEVEKATYYSFNTESVSFGSTLSKIFIGDEDGNDRFIIKSTYTKVEKIVLQPPTNKNSVFSKAFKVHEDTNIIIRLQKLDSNYGFGDGSPAELTIKYKEWEHTIEKQNSVQDLFQYEIEEGEDKVLNTLYKEYLYESRPSELEFNLTLKNDFGDSVSESFVLKMDYTKEPNISGVSLYPGKDASGNNYPALDKWSYLKQEMPLVCDATILAFEKPQVSFEIEGADGVFESIEKPDFKEEALLEDRMEPNIWSLESFYFCKIPEIFHDITDVSFTLKIETSGYVVLYKIFNKSLTILAHRPSKVRFTELRYDGSSLVGKCQVDDIGLSDEAEGQAIRLDVYAKELTKSIADTDSLGEMTEYEINLIADFENEEFLHLAPQLTTKMCAYYTKGKTGFETEKTTDIFEYTLVYNKLPTVSYRPNYLGINTSFDSDTPTDTTIQIGAYNTRDKIYLKGTEKTACVDLSNGALVSFIVDCGSWSGVPGGILPGGGTPEGLAAVAYSGKFIDLQQDQEDSITFIGRLPSDKI